MIATLEYGGLTGHAIGIIMREAVRRAMLLIQKNRHYKFKVHVKLGSSGKMDDVYTDVDTAAQALYIKILSQCFPTFGIAAEEGLSVPCSHDLNIHFTVDPLDGTRAFIQRQSYGIGTMISLICSGTVLAAYVGNVISQEIYGSRPGSNNVWKFDESDEHAPPEKLCIDTSKPCDRSYVLLTDSHYKHSKFAQHLTGPINEGGLFKGYHVMNGSIGTNMAQLWKGEVAAMILRQNVETPWDSCPTYGLSKKLGFIVCKIDHINNQLVPYEPRISPITRFRPFEVLIVHGNYFEQIAYKLKKQKT